jgi:hypothetical protein
MILSPFNHQEHPVSIPNLIDSFHNYNLFLKGAPRMEFGVGVQATRPIGARVKRKFRTTSCLNFYMLLHTK